MDENLKRELDRWHEDGEHQKIIDTIMALPEEERDYELTGRLARALNNREDYEGAVRQLLSVCRQGEGDPLWHFRLGYAFYYLDRDEEARAEFERVLDLDPEDQAAREMLGCLMDPECYAEEEMDALEGHIEAQFGPVESVLHELASPDIHVDICVIPPNSGRNFYTLVTMGMGAHRMNVPEEIRGKGLDRAELVICLPPDWEIQNWAEQWFWPIRWLKILARLPGQEDAWLGWGHTVPNDGPFAENTDLCCIMLVDSAFGDASATCTLPGGDIVNFYQLLPLYREEMEYKLSHDAQALLARMEAISPVLDLRRTNWCGDVAEDAEDAEDAEEGRDPTFRERVDAFWAWFLENEAAVAEMVEHRESYEAEEILNFITEGTDLIAEDLHFNIGGDLEFSFTTEGEEALFYLLPYVTARMPEELEGKWRFSPYMHSAGGRDFEFAMYGRTITTSKVRVGILYDAPSKKFHLRFYEEQLAALEEGEAYDTFYILMEISIGEGFARVYVEEAERADAPEEDMFPLTELEGRMAGMIESAGQERLARPDQSYSAYECKPEQNEELRYDVITGTTCCAELIAEYYEQSTELLDSFAACGAAAAFLAFPYYGEEARNRALKDRRTLENRLEKEILGARGSGEEIGILLGGSMGAACCYIDLLLYDEPEFRERAAGLLAEYPYKCYLSAFRQHCDLALLSGEGG